MRTIIWLIYFCLYLLFLWPKMARAKRLQKAGRQAECDSIVQEVIPRWARSLLKLAGARVRVTGLENIPGEAAVFISNHQGDFDIPILLASLNAAHPLIAKKAMLKIPFIRTWMALLGCQFIDRQNPRQSMSCLNEAARALTQEGRSFIIFPEGTRSLGEELGEFKSGGFKIASKTGAPIVPIAIQGSYRLFEANGRWIRPADAQVTILPPVETRGLSREEVKALGERIQAQIQEQLIANHEHTEVR